MSDPAPEAKPESFARSALWQTLDRALLGSLGFAVNVLVARWIGVEASGQLAGAYALIALASAFTSLGLESSMPRVLVRRQYPDAEVLATALLVRRSSGLLTLVVAVSLAWQLEGGYSQYVLLIALLGALWLVPGGEVIELFWIAKGQSRNYLPPKVLALTCGRLTKLAAAHLTGLAWPVAAAQLLEAAIGELTQRLALGRRAIDGTWRASRRAANALLKNNLPLIVSTLAVLGYHRLDQLMVLQLRGPMEAGHYAAAIQIYELSLAAILIIGKAATRTITAAACGADSGLTTLTQQLRTVSMIGWLAAPAFWFGSDLMVGILYGDAFAAAAEPLRWLGLATVWAGMGTVSGIWMIARGLERLTLQRTLLGLAVNAALNLLLIPRYGPAGAAMATLAAQMAACWGVDILNRPTQAVFRLKLLALLSPFPMYRS